MEPRSESRPVISPGVFLFFMLLAAIEWRAVPAVRANLIEEDGAHWAGFAAALARGDWAHGLSTTWPPGYPALVAVLAWIARAASHPAMLEGCARFVSVIAGTLVLVPLFGLARRLLPEAPARAVAMLAAFHPRLMTYSAAALSEMTFTLFLVTGLAAFAAAEDEAASPGARSVRQLVAGAALGASYLVRPEGLLLAIGLWFVGLAHGRSRLARMRPAFLIALVIVALPYLMFVHTRLGTWSLGEKGSYNFWRAYRTEYGRMYAPPVNLAHRVNQSPELAEAPADADRVHVLGFMRARPGLVIGSSVRRLARIVFDTIPTTLYWPIAVIALLGFVGTRSGPWWILVTPLVLSPLIYAPFSTDRRFFVPLVPLLLVACGQAFRWLDERWAASTSAPAASPTPRLGRVARIAALVLVGYSIVWSLWLLREQNPAKEQRAMGEWLRHASAGSARPVVAARKPWVAFYSGGLIAELPDSIPGRLAQLERPGRPVFVVADARSAQSDRPQLAPLLDTTAVHPALVLAHAIEAPMPIRLYRVAADSARR